MPSSTYAIAVVPVAAGGVLFFLDIAAFFTVVAAWFAIVITGRYARGMFGFVEGIIRWNVRVTGYALTLVTDRYPPFRLAA